MAKEVAPVDDLLSPTSKGSGYFAHKSPEVVYGYSHICQQRELNMIRTYSKTDREDGHPCPSGGFRIDPKPPPSSPPSAAERELAGVETQQVRTAALGGLSAYPGTGREVSHGRGNEWLGNSFANGSKNLPRITWATFAEGAAVRTIPVVSASVKTRVRTTAWSVETGGPLIHVRIGASRTDGTATVTKLGCCATRTP